MIPAPSSRWCLCAALAALCLASRLPAHIHAPRVDAPRVHAPRVDAASGPTPLLLHSARTAPDDLEIGGSLAGVPAGQTRFVTRAQLESLPQQTFTVSDDPNLTGTVTLTGIPLQSLPTLLGAAPRTAMIIARCDDDYAAHYPAAYIAAHHPVLVLRINGHPPAAWPLGADGSALGPYFISHPHFIPRFRVLAHTDEEQVPWGVVRLDLRNEQQVYAPIMPLGPHAADELVQQGYTIARQSCFRCHAAATGDPTQHRTKSGTPWSVLAHRAATNPTFFDQYVRNPRSLNRDSQMAASPQYDDATLHALRAYFTTFVPNAPPSSVPTATPESAR